MHSVVYVVCEIPLVFRYAIRSQKVMCPHLSKYSLLCVLYFTSLVYEIVFMNVTFNVKNTQSK